MRGLVHLKGVNQVVEVGDFPVWMGGKEGFLRKVEE